MVTVTEIGALCASLKGNDPRIDKIVLVAHEGHLINKLSDFSGLILAAVYPSANRNGELNEAVDDNATWFFALEKDVSGQSDAEEEAQFQKLQDVITSIRDYVEETAVTSCSFLSRYKPSGTKIEPEWREFGGFNGWSMSLVF